MTHISLIGIEGGFGAIETASFGLQRIDGIRPVLRYQLNDRPRTLYNTAVRPVVQCQFEGPRFDGGTPRLL